MFNTFFSCLGFFMGAGGMGGPSPLSMSSEKIYPADQPMVFNPQNPNAPPIYPCGICHKEVHDNDQVGLFTSFPAKCHNFVFKVETTMYRTGYR